MYVILGNSNEFMRQGVEAYGYNVMHLVIMLTTDGLIVKLTHRRQSSRHTYKGL